MLFWQGQKDSNPQQRFWRPTCYHYTMPLCGSSGIAGTGFSLAPFHPFVKRFCENCSELAENRPVLYKTRGAWYDEGRKVGGRDARAVGGTGSSVCADAWRGVHAAPRGRNAGGTGAAAGRMAIPAGESIQARTGGTARATLPGCAHQRRRSRVQHAPEIPPCAGGFAACPDARRVGGLPVRWRQHVRRDAKGAGGNRRAGQPIPRRVWGGKRGHIRQHEPRD